MVETKASTHKPKHAAVRRTICYTSSVTCCCHAATKDCKTARKKRFSSGNPCTISLRIAPQANCTDSTLLDSSRPVQSHAVPAKMISLAVNYSVNCLGWFSWQKSFSMLSMSRIWNCIWNNELHHHLVPTSYCSSSSTRAYHTPVSNEQTQHCTQNCEYEQQYEVPEKVLLILLRLRQHHGVLRHESNALKCLRYLSSNMSNSSFLLFFSFFLVFWVLS